jgi:hypothetical protein
VNFGPLDLEEIHHFGSRFFDIDDSFVALVQIVLHFESAFELLLDFMEAVIDVNEYNTESQGESAQDIEKK